MMGCFSFITLDTEESITAKYSRDGALPVYMKDNKGNVWREYNYEGYGMFEGKDFYLLIAEMNGLENPCRDGGIMLYFDVGSYRSDKGIRNPIFPSLTESRDWEWDGRRPDDCPDQGSGGSMWG